MARDSAYFYNAEQRRQAAARKAIDDSYNWAVYHHTGTGVYKPEDAVKVFKRKSDAERYAQKAYEADSNSDLVARFHHRKDGR